MANQWLKLYGVEMLSDPKYQRLTSSERSCWITLLCLGSMDNGTIKHCEEEYLMLHSGIDIHSREWQNTRGILSKLEMLGMITLLPLQSVEIRNWVKRQGRYTNVTKLPMTVTERVRKHRLNKDKIDNVTKCNEMLTDNRIEENRIEENREGERATKVATPYEVTKSFFESDEIQKEYTSIIIEKGIPESIAKAEMQKFVSYWTEPTKSGLKSRWELEKAFEIKRRLATWFSRINGFTSKNKPTWKIWA